MDGGEEARGPVNDSSQAGRSDIVVEFTILIN